MEENNDEKPILEVINLVKNYKEFGLNGINFCTKKGKITGFIGINGAGKTTTIKSIAGLIIPNGGEIRFWGEIINAKNESKIRDRIGFLFDGDYYYPELSVRQMSKIFSHAYSCWDEKIYENYIKRFNLPLKQKIKTLSKGMKMKFSLMLALSHHAQMLIMDEPTDGLDPLVRSELLTILEDLAKKGVSILFSTHITSDLEKIADDIVLIHHGKILFQKDMKVLKSTYFVVTGDIDFRSQTAKKTFLKIKKSKKNDELLGLYNGDREILATNFPNAKIEVASIEDIMFGSIWGNANK